MLSPCLSGIGYWKPLETVGNLWQEEEDFEARQKSA